MKNILIGCYNKQNNNKKFIKATKERLQNLDKRITIIKDINLEYLPLSHDCYIDAFKFIETVEDSCSISICHTQEQFNLHKLIYRRDDEKQEFIFGITNQASDKFPVLKLVDTLVNENKMLIQQNANLYNKIDDLKLQNNINEFALKSYQENKLIKFIKFLRLI